MRRNGFTIIELLMVMVVSGVMMLVGFPRIRDAVVKSDVRSARNAIVAMHARARATATQTSRQTYVAFSGNTAVVLMRMQAAGAWADSVGPVEDLHEQFGVSVIPSTDTLRFDPRGFGLNGGTVIVRRSGFADTVTVSGFGRILR